MFFVLMAYILCGFTLSMLGSEFRVAINWCNAKYRYQSKEYVDYCNSQGILCSYNTIFISDLKYYWDSGTPPDAKEKFPDEFKKIKHLPVDLFIKDFQSRDTIFSMRDFFVGNNMNSRVEDEESARHFKAVFGCDGRITRENLEEHIRIYPFSYEYRSDDLEKKQKFEDIRTECLADGRLAMIGNRLVHGPNGYFGPEEYNKTVREYRKGMLFYYLPRLLCGAGFLFGGYYLLSKYSK